MADVIEWGGTPGPWVYREWECDPRVNEDGNRYWGIVPKEFARGFLYLEASGWMLEANARAIAEVPAMVKALRLAEFIISSLEGDPDWSVGDDLKIIRGVIARIDGKA